MLFHQGVFAVKGDGVEVEVERHASRQAQASHRIEPAAHQLGIGGRINATAILGQEGALGDHIQPGKQGQAGVEDVGHHVTVTARAEQLQSQQGAQSMLGRDHGGAGKRRSLRDLLPGDAGQEGQEKEEPPEGGAKLARRQIQLAHVGDGGGESAGTLGPFVILASRQPREAFFLEDQGDGHRAALLSLLLQGSADVVDGEVLFAQGDDLLAHAILGGMGAGCAARGEEEFQLRVLPQLVAEEAETAGGVAEALGGLGGGEAFDEKRPERLVLAVEGVLGHQEDLGEAVGR